MATIICGRYLAGDRYVLWRGVDDKKKSLNIKRGG